MKKILGVIPARYASTRYPGKPLIILEGMSMIERVYNQALKCKSLSDVIIATDDESIFNHVTAFGAKAIMTDAQLASGTDRCQAAIKSLHWNGDYVVNIQGDEPLINPEQIDSLCRILDGETQIATIIRRENDMDRLQNFNEVKVVCNSQSEGMYFSRSIIPAQKNVPLSEWSSYHHYYVHVGLYAYRTDILEEITSLPVSDLEQTESLEQLRWLQAGYIIKCEETTLASHSIDTPEDVASVLAILQHRA